MVVGIMIDRYLHQIMAGVIRIKRFEPLTCAFEDHCSTIGTNDPHMGIIYSITGNMSLLTAQMIAFPIGRCLRASPPVGANGLTNGGWAGA